MDNVGLFDVLEHFENDVKLLKLVHYFLKDNGFIFVTVPAFNLLWTQIDDISMHFKRYSIKDLINILRKSGFKIIYATYFFSLFIIPLFLIRKIPYLLGKNYTYQEIQKRENNCHKKTNIINKYLNKFFNLELYLIKNNFKIPFGTSCYVIAQKI